MSLDVLVKRKKWFCHRSSRLRFRYHQVWEKQRHIVLPLCLMLNIGGCCAIRRLQWPSDAALIERLQDHHTDIEMLVTQFVRDSNKVALVGRQYVYPSGGGAFVPGKDTGYSQVGFSEARYKWYLFQLEKTGFLDISLEKQGILMSAQQYISLGEGPEKGYLYASHPLSSTETVPSLDIIVCRHSQRRYYFRHVIGPWYLYMKW